MEIRVSEKGQSIVILALALVGLLAFSALAVDGGTVLVERRRAQSAADSAAYASALAGINGENWYTAGIDQAAVNGYNNNGDDNTVEVYNPPISGPYMPPHSMNAFHYQVFITTTSTPVFSQFVFQDGLVNKVEAVARAIPDINLGWGNALYATSPDACKAVWFNGSSEMRITGGGVFSNSDADGTSGGANCISGVEDGAAGDVIVDGGGISVVGAWSQHGPDTVTTTGGIQAGVPSETLPPVPPIDCSGLTPRNDNSDSLEPGVYAGGIRNTNSDVTLAPGLYCMQDDLKLTGGTLSGEGVFMYFESGSIDISGNAEVSLTAPYDLIGPSGTQWAGMLFYMPESNSGQIQITGNSSSNYEGTILAPGPASPASKEKCMLTGSGDTFALNSQVICYTVKVTGNADVHIIYDNNRNFHLPPNVELVQ